MNRSGWITIWDPLVRTLHWVLVAAFAVAYATEDDLLIVHVWAGYAVGAVVVLRVLWGFVGTRHARFSDFVTGPRRAIDYLKDLIRFRAPRHLGHSPAGGAMAVALLIVLAATVGTGLATYAVREGKGPLAPWLAAPAPIVEADAGLSKREIRRRKPGHLLKEAHEFLADLALAMIVLHLAGVALASVAHRENLVRAMIDGKKRPDDGGTGHATPA